MPAHPGTPLRVRRGRLCPDLAPSPPGPGPGVRGRAGGWGLRDWAESPEALSVASAAGGRPEAETRRELQTGLDGRWHHTWAWPRAGAAPRVPAGLTALRGSRSGVMRAPGFQAPLGPQDRVGRGLQ